VAGKSLKRRIHQQAYCTTLELYLEGKKWSRVEYIKDFFYNLYLGDCFAAPCFARIGLFAKLVHLWNFFIDASRDWKTPEPNCVGEKREDCVNRVATMKGANIVLSSSRDSGALRLVPPGAATGGVTLFSLNF